VRLRPRRAQIAAGRRVTNIGAGAAVAVVIFGCLVISASSSFVSHREEGYETAYSGLRTAPLLGALWMVVLATTVACGDVVCLGAPFRPVIWLSLLWGGGLARGRLLGPLKGLALAVGGRWCVAASFVGVGPSRSTRPHCHRIAGALWAWPSTRSML
jgi:hypothetical protein